MDISRLMRLVDEASKVVPSEYRKAFIDGVGQVANVLDEVANLIDDPRVKKPESQSIYDDVRNDVGNPPGSFEDIVAGWDTQPDAERGGSGDDKSSARIVVDSIYRFLTEHTEVYSEYNEDNAQWNMDNPMHVVIDFLSWLSEQKMLGRMG